LLDRLWLEHANRYVARAVQNALNEDYIVNNSIEGNVRADQDRAPALAKFLSFPSWLNFDIFARSRSTRRLAVTSPASCLTYVVISRRSRLAAAV
jgi:hypothetical protein